MHLDHRRILNGKKSYKLNNLFNTVSRCLCQIVSVAGRTRKSEIRILVGLHFPKATACGGIRLGHITLDTHLCKILARVLNLSNL